MNKYHLCGKKAVFNFYFVVFINGFNFDDIPSDAVINSFTIKLKAYESGLSTSYTYAP